MYRTRIDSWAADLGEDQAWTLYYKALRCQWNEAAAFAVKEFGLESMPSRTAFYKWMRQMRESEHEHRMGQAAIAAAEAAALGHKATKDEAIVQALKALATEAALQSDAKTANSLIASAMAIKDRLLKTEEVRLRTRAQSVKEEELKIAQQKLEIELAKSAKAVETLKQDKLTPEERDRKLREIFGLS